MKRENLYRGKRVEDGRWIEGSLIGDDVIVGKILEFEEDYVCTEFWYKVDERTVGEFVGYNDGVGVKIYEDDMIAGDAFARDFIYLCRWNEKIMQLEFVNYRTSDTISLSSMRDLIERSGDNFKVFNNIHDNTQLS